ncbi:MAG: dehydrogenase subunit [Deferribacteraceae bacterium]|nr:dehydrogenase subunit [Deferribacteraceae bacterium]
MGFESLLKELAGKFDSKINGYTQYGCNFINAPADIAKEVLKSLKCDYGFTYLVDIVAIHWPKKNEKFELSYNLFNVDKKLRVFVKVALAEPEFETVTDIWKSADFLEREQYDLVGVTFKGHPDLRRILMPDFFEGHPLRKEYGLKDRSWFNSVDEQNLGIKFTK